MLSDDIKINLDDSSDEEDVKKMPQYNIDKAWEKFIQPENFLINRGVLFSQKKKGTEAFWNIDLTSVKLSFVAHALGIQFLHHPEINRFYYQLKQQKLKTDELQRDEVVNLIQTTLKKCVSEVGEFSCRLYIRDQKNETLNQDLQGQFQKILQKSLTPKIYALTENLVIRDVLKQKENQPLSATLKNILQPFQIDLVETIVGFMDQYQLIYRKPLADEKIEDPTRFDSILKLHNTAIKLALEGLNYFGAINSTNPSASEWTFLNKDKNKRRQAIFDNRIFELIKTYRYKNLLKTVWNKVKDFSGKALVEKALENIPSGVLAKALLKDLRAEQNYSITNEAWKLVKQFLVLKPFFIIGKERFLDLLRINFNDTFVKNIIAGKTQIAVLHILRPTLLDNSVHTSKSQPQFFAEWRLVNRSQTREIKNLQNNSLIRAVHDKQPNDEKGRHYVKKSHRTWNFFPADQSALETQGISTNFGRDDVVDTAESYQVIYKRLSRLVTYLQETYKPEPPINDKAIAIWIEEILFGKPLSRINELKIPVHEQKTLQSLLVSFTYLIFGCEVARNPAMVIFSHMILGLMKKNLSLEEAITNNKENFSDGGLLPMTPDDAVALARTIQAIYHNYMPYHYKYRGRKLATREKIKDLIEREAKLMHKWLSQEEGLDDDETFMTARWALMKPSKIAEKIIPEFDKWLLCQKETDDSEEAFSEFFSQHLKI